jgi:hypothetical protein
MIDARRPSGIDIQATGHNGRRLPGTIAFRFNRAHKEFSKVRSLRQGQTFKLIYAVDQDPAFKEQEGTDDVYVSKFLRISLIS